ncbi:MAG: DUF5686 family protein [Mediterranea sp.]|nr:DUF5686 family protein [Mediterranea sp.]
MKHLVHIIVWICLLLVVWQEADATLVPKHLDKRPLATVDSIMERVIFYAPLYEHIIDTYTAELYIKGVVNIEKKNQLLRFLPTMFRVRNNIREYVMETYSDVRYTAPDIYDQKLKATVSTSSRFWELDGQLPDYFRINVYAPTLLPNKLLSPLASNARSYYTYHIDSVFGEQHERQYKIRFLPKSESFQLINGYLVVSENVWSVRELFFESRSELMRLRNTIKLGEVGTDNEFLPARYDIQAKFRFLGNVAYANYTALLDYQSITQKASDTPDRRRQPKSKYDLTESYTLRTDTNAYQRDTTYFNRIRPLPLTTYEDSLYHRYFQQTDTTLHPRKPRSKSRQFWGQVGDVLVSRNTLNMAKFGSIRFSPLLNPALVSYSSSRGISYRQDFRYTRIFTGDRVLQIRPRIGYNFKLKEFYWSVNGDFDYWPSKRASLHIDAGNGNRIYSSDVLTAVKDSLDGIFDLSKIHLDYFRDFYLNVRHTWEITNGLTFEAGFSSHRRSEINRSQLVPITPTVPSVDPNTSATRQSDNGEDESTASNGGTEYRLRHVYNSFAPHLKLTWRPGQYYYMDGQRKINLHYKYPGISVDWERGISGIFNSSGTYERLEVDVQYALQLGLMRSLYLRVGGGAFTNQEQMYFVDFANLRRSNLPVGWNDEIGGVFQLLDGVWYNSSRKYLRAHAVYQSPFVLLTRLRKITRYVLSERFYLNGLIMPQLKPYVEIGYGVGTHIFDVGFFVSFANWKYEEVGVKATFELFNK